MIRTVLNDKGYSWESESVQGEDVSDKLINRVAGPADIMSISTSRGTRT